MTTTMPDHGGLPRTGDDTEDDRPWTDPSLPVTERVETLLARLTLEEKVAQLSSTWDDIEADGPEVAPGSNHFGRVGDLDEVARHGLGQLTRPYGTLPRPALDHARLLAGHQRQIVRQSRHGIPAMAHDECLTGFTAYGATIYPTSLGMAATFDPELIRRVGEAIGADMAEAGVHQGLSPVVDVIRDYRWGRCEETYGEDPYLVGEMGRPTSPVCRVPACTPPSSTSPGTPPPWAAATTPPCTQAAVNSSTSSCRPSNGSSPRECARS